MHILYRERPHFSYPTPSWEHDAKSHRAQQTTGSVGSHDTTSTACVGSRAGTTLCRQLLEAVSQGLCRRAQACQPIPDGPTPPPRRTKAGSRFLQGRQSPALLIDAWLREARRRPLEGEFLILSPGTDSSSMVSADTPRGRADHPNFGRRCYRSASRRVAL